MNKTSIIVLIALALTACGGGGGGGGGSTSTAPVVVAPPPPPPPPPYNYTALNGRYSCVKTGSPIITLDAVFTATEATIKMSSVGLSFAPVVYKDKVGMVGGFPYYSQNTQLTSNAETLFWFNGQLTIVNGPQANVPNLLAQNFTSVFYCTKG